MIDTIATLLLIVVLLVVFFQDYRDRMVYWFLYPLSGILAFSIQYCKNGFWLSLVNSAWNIGFVIVLLGCSYFYTSKVMNKDYFETIGQGDILLFLALTFCFSPIPFYILLVFSMIFSLILHLILKGRGPHATVPLAGNMSIFFAAIYIVSLFIPPKFLYA